MKIDLTDATFIIPIRIESEDRLRNVITSVAFLLNNFNTNIIVKEVDKTSVFKQRALPQLESFFGEVNVKHIFEESDEPLFHRQKVLNEMIVEADTEIVVNYDCDVILPLESYVTAYVGIKEKVYDVVYPYGDGMYQRQVNAEDKIVSAFLDSNDYSVLDAVSNEHTSDFGWASSSDAVFILKVAWKMKTFEHMLLKIKKGILDLPHWDIKLAELTMLFIT